MIEALPDSTRNIWLTYFDAGRRAPNIKADYFLEGESNDTFFWPEAVAATVNAIPGTKNHTWGPNLDHTQLPSGGTMQRLHFDYPLKGIGSPFATVNISNVAVQTDGFYQQLQLRPFRTGEVFDSLIFSEESRCCQIDTFIGRLRRQDRRDRELDWRFEIKRACRVGVFAFEDAGDSGGGAGVHGI